MVKHQCVISSLAAESMVFAITRLLLALKQRTFFGFRNSLLTASKLLLVHKDYKVVTLRGLLDLQ